MTVGFKDLRDWMKIVEDQGKLRTVTEVQLTDMGRVAELSARTMDGPTLVIGGFSGYDQGKRIMLNPYGSTRQIAVTFGLPALDDRVELLEKLKSGIAGLQLLPPTIVNDGPILENVVEDQDVDLMQFPVPKWHESDGGEYMGTGSLVLTRDPDEGWVNFAAYRLQRHSKNELGWYVSPGHHGFVHRNKYFARGESCPIVAVVGSDPLFFAASMSELPWGVSELDWVGGWRGKGVPVVEGRHTGLPIPAFAEIAIEGFVHPNNRKPEGPFGEWTGYYASSNREEPVIDVKAIYYRNNPILLGIPPQKPPFDADKCRQFIKSALLTNQLKKQGIPGIVNAWCYGIGGGRLLIAVAINQQYPGHAKQVGHAVYATPFGNYLGRYVIIVDEDIDVTDLQDTVWALLTRTDPVTSIDFITKATSSVLDPTISPKDKAEGRLFNSRAIIDATRPYEWKQDFPKQVAPGIEHRRATTKMFGHLFE